MKSKIVNMKNDKNNEENYSTMISKLIEPFVDEFPEEMSYNEIIQFACYAWNMACMSRNLPDEETTKMFSSFEVPDEYLILLNKMIEMKKEEFPDYKYLIDDFNIEEKDGEMILSVYTMAEDDYFDKRMFDSLSSYINDDEFGLDESDYYPGYIDRVSLFVKAKQPFLEWRNEVYVNEFVYRDYEPTVYLISDDNSDIEKWLKKNYNEIFMRELDSWNENEKTWPQKRSFKMFKQWFSIDFGTMVYDLEEEPVIKGVLII